MPRAFFSRHAIRVLMPCCCALPDTLPLLAILFIISPDIAISVFRFSALPAILIDFSMLSLRYVATIIFHVFVALRFAFDTLMLSPCCLFRFSPPSFVCHFSTSFIAIIFSERRAQRCRRRHRSRRSRVAQRCYPDVYLPRFFRCRARVALFCRNSAISLPLC